jgi:hypothetical protein
LAGGRSVTTWSPSSRATVAEHSTEEFRRPPVAAQQGSAEFAGSMQDADAST